MGSILPVSVVIDGTTRGRLSPGKEITLELPPGPHDLIFSYSKGDASGRVNIKSGRTASCDISVSKWDVSLKVQIDEG